MANKVSKERLVARSVDVIAEQLGVERAEVALAASFVDDLGADSIDVVELLMAFEEEFGIEIPDEDAEKVVRVDDAIAYLEGRLC
mgnify:CR=1 FL=1